MPDIPVSMDERPVILPTPSGKGVVILYRDYIHELICTETRCEWKKTSHQLPVSRQYFNAMYIDDELTTCQ